MRQEKNRLQKIKKSKKSTIENQKIKKITLRAATSPPLAAACIPDRGDAAKPAHLGTVWARRSAARRGSLCHKLKQR